MVSYRFLAASAALAASANAHLFMNSPVPISGTAIKDPLAADGSNFPCHGANFITGQGGQSMAVGSPQTLSFDTGNGANWAVHGGGSCQISITYETDAAKVKDPSNWKVLYSIIGGCPTNFPDNLNVLGAYPCNDTTKTNGVECVNSFQYTLPPEVKNGKATLAWTWFNSIGNREMYMNCADVTVTGGTGTGYDSLPAMEVANIAAGNGATCGTPAYAFYSFPNAGKYVTTKTLTGTQTALVSTLFSIVPFSGAGCGATAAAVATTGATAATTTAAAAQATSAAGGMIGNSAAATSKTSAAGGVFAPGAASATTLVTATAQTTAVSAPATTAAAQAPAAASVVAPAPAANGSASTGTCAAGSTACPTDGIVVCLPNNKWGLCDHGCVVPQLMAAGMQCSAGTMKAATGSKARRAHPHGLAHRRRSIGM